MEPSLLSVPPTVRVDLQTEDGYRVIECSAADAVPAANMSWLLPEGVSGVSWFNFTSHNGSHSVKGVLLLPACTPLELTAECVINHPAFEEPVNRSITLPLCGMFDKSSGGKFCLSSGHIWPYKPHRFLSSSQKKPLTSFGLTSLSSSPTHRHQLQH